MNGAQVVSQPDRQLFLSIVTVSRNAGSTIGATLQSVANQKGVDGIVEHWVVDGGSTDNTMEVVRQFPNVRYISEPDQGISDAFNKGMNLAQGQYILYLNCDDILCDENVLADVYQFVQNRQFPDWIAGRWFARRLDGTVALVHLKYPMSCGGLSLQLCICHQAVLLKRELQQQMGGFNLDYRLAMDYDLWARLCLAGYCITPYNRPIVVYAYGGASYQNEKLAKQELSSVTQRLRNTPMKRLIGMPHDSLVDLWRYVRRLVAR
jgi:glycosyltransferase involved in cell wall biosynthesis